MRNISFKNIVILTLIGVLIFNGVSALKITDSKQEQVTLFFNDLSIQESNTFTTVEIEGLESTCLYEHQYIIPTSFKTFTFPIGTKIEKISGKVSNIYTQKLNKPLKIAPDFLTAENILYKEESEDSQSTDIKNKWFDYRIGCGIEGNKRCIIVKVQFFPVQYIPINNTIRSTEVIDITIEYSQPTITPLINEEYDFIILTASSFSQELQELVTHKINRGILTKLITIDEILDSTYFEVQGRDESESVKYFIKNAYDQWGITNVLLVGGSDFFPVRYSNINVIDEEETYGCSFVSDLYYADLYDINLEFSSWDSNNNNVFGEYEWDGRFDEVDLFPDVHIGRLACVSRDEVACCVDKIITYENSKAYTTDWFSKIVLIGGDSAPGDEESVDEGEYANLAALDIMNGFLPVNVWASNGDLYSKSAIRNALDDGAGFVYFSGHGNLRIWSTHPHENENIWLPPAGFKSMDVSILINNDKLPIVVADACYIGEFNEASDCFSWSFLSNQYGGGIAVFSSTYTSFFYPTSYVTQDIIGKIALDTFRAYKLDRAITLGEMWSRTLNRYISTNMDSADYFTVEEWSLFGDPTLSIAKESIPPAKPSISGPTSGIVGEELSYMVSTTDADGDTLYYLLDWGNNQFSNWIGPFDSGQSINVPHNWEEEGTYEIRVTAKDDHGVQSEWSDPLEVILPKTKQMKNQFLILLERYPQIYQILRFIEMT